MLKLSLRDVRAHIGRYVLTFIAVAIGVAFIGGVTTLTDTITRTFDDLFADVNAGTDAVVRGPAQFEVGADFGGGEQRPRIDASVAEQIAAVDGVAEVSPSVDGYTQLIDENGDPHGDPNFGPPTIGTSWDEVDALNPFNLVGDSRAPQNADEVVIDKASADALDLRLGDAVRFQTPKGDGEAELVGIAKFGTADSPFGASFVMFDLATAEEQLAEPGRIDSVGIVADDGVSQTEVRDRVQRALGDDFEVVTGDEITKENQDDASDTFQFLRIFLLIFALISIVVGAFVIYTSFSFIVAQRQRQVALLRAVGASRRQVLWSVVVEAAVVGLVASIVGYLLGIGLASLLSRLFSDAASLTVLPMSVVFGLLVGTLVTLGSAFFPAWRASRVPPVAAMRDVEIDTSHRSVIRFALGIVVLALGVLLLVTGLSSGTLAAAGLGVALVFASLVILGPIAARPAATTLGGPLPRLRGVVGRLAQQNAARNPKRTASTGSALMIGLGIVSLFLVFNASLRQSLDDLVDDRFHGDLVVDSGTGFVPGGGLPGEVASDIKDLPEVDAATGVRFAPAEVGGSTSGVSGIDPESGFDLFDVGVVAGDVGDLDDDGIAVFKDKADDEGWQVGDQIDVKFAETGEKKFTIAALLDTRDLTGTYVMSSEAFDSNIPTFGDSQIWIRLADGVSVAEGRAAIEPLLRQFPTAELQDLGEFKDATKEQFNFFLILVTALLALTIIIAMVGIVNTLILSVVERTREIGLTRAVGATRGQIRSTIRWEALLIAAFGLMAALGSGVFFGWVFVSALEDEGFTSFVVPFGSLIVVTLLTAFLTLLAAVFPAIWAGRRPILSAITHG